MIEVRKERVVEFGMICTRKLSLKMRRLNKKLNSIFQYD